MATDLHLARKAGGDIAPRGVAEEGRATMWSFWAMTEAERRALAILFHRVVPPEDKRGTSAAQAVIDALKGSA